MSTKTIEILLSVALILLLIYFKYLERKQHSKDVELLTQIRDNIKAQNSQSQPQQPQPLKL